MSTIHITSASMTDLAIVKQIAEQTFVETFAENNKPEAMTVYVTKNFTDEVIAAELKDPDSHFFIAWDGGLAIGYLKLNTGQAQTELRDETGLEIERIYVAKNYLGQKVGQLLYEKAIEVAHQLQKQFVWLGVWEENPRAIRFYSKNGFVPFDQHIFMLGDEKQTDIMMRKYLR